MRNLAESAQMTEWLSKEGDFQLEQERTRAAIRIKERRAKAVDFLAQNLRYASTNSEENTSWDSVEDDGAEIDLDEPYIIVEVSTCTLAFYFPLTSHLESIFGSNCGTKRGYSEVPYPRKGAYQYRILDGKSPTCAQHTS
jgi:hypothetical protein